MMPRLVSRRFPYVPLQVLVGHQELQIEALLDTGFDGDLVLPASLLPDTLVPDGFVSWRLADGSDVYAPYHVGEARLDQLATLPAVITVLGDEPLVGRGVADHFSITLDHGAQLVVEP
jgi:predicted aspartyl protease